MLSKFGITHIIALVFAALFMAVFVFQGAEGWQNRFSSFSVPAHSYPGGDARNIQLTAHCAAISSTPLGHESCYERAVSLRALYPEMVIPTYNYPSIWARAYALFKNNSEPFFMNAWRLNASLLILTILLLSLRYYPLAFPVFAFSPITLLTVERGNIDASTFFILFMPLLLARGHPFVSSLFMGIAAGVKIFPLFAFGAFFHPRLRSSLLAFLAGLAISAPLAIMSLLELPVILAETTKSFTVSYGLTSLLRAPYFWGQEGSAYLLMVSYLLVLVVVLRLASSTRHLEPLKTELAQLDKTSLTLLLASLAIFLMTFLVFNNWSYRLIFLIPAFMVLSNLKSRFAVFCTVYIAVLFWLPMLPYGWDLQNIACFPLSLLLSVIALSTFSKPSVAD